MKRKKQKTFLKLFLYGISFLQQTIPTKDKSLESKYKRKRYRTGLNCSNHKISISQKDNPKTMKPKQTAVVD